MLAVAVAALAFLPALPPEPTEPPPETWITSGPTGTVYDTTATFEFISSDEMTYRCSLDGASPSLCTSPYTTPALGLGGHTFTVAGRGVGGWDLSPDRASWTIATRPAPTPAPTATATPPASTPVPTVTPAPTPDPTGGEIAGAAHAADTKPAATTKAPAVLAAPLPSIDVSLLYFMNAKQRYTRFATLSLKKVPAGATITVTCKGGCPAGKQKIATANGGTVRLDKWLRKRLKTGATLTIAVTKPGMRGISKAVTMRAERRPRIVTRVFDSQAR
jgi:hypothetical protein